jgi:hypothetical protein
MCSLAAYEAFAQAHAEADGLSRSSAGTRV